MNDQHPLGEPIDDMPLGVYMTRLQEDLAAMRAQKDAAYTERNRLVALLAALFPSSLERHPEEDTAWDPEWRWICFIDLPSGQASWHLHDAELPLFAHVPRNQGRVWDGHTTDEKYRRVKGAVGLAQRHELDLRAVWEKMVEERQEGLALSSDQYRCRYCGGQVWKVIERQDEIDMVLGSDRPFYQCARCGNQMANAKEVDICQRPIPPKNC